MKYQIFNYNCPPSTDHKNHVVTDWGLNGSDDFKSEDISWKENECRIEMCTLYKFVVENIGRQKESV